MKKGILWFLMVFVAAINVAFAANIKIEGTVLDDSGDPVIGAAVMIKGTKQGVQTDIDGKFQFASIPEGSTLVVSYVGMKTVEVKAVPNITITLQPNQETLDTVIVTAFGTAKKSSFTGSASVLDADKIEQKQVTNVMQSLLGEVPGLDIAPSTAPGSTSDIIIRGEGTINAGTDPLIVVDGMPYEGSWNHINPADVESITVLKDAASSALYGARGANGVIMITTKKGNVGQSIVNFDAKWGANMRAGRDYDRITEPGQYYEAYYRALFNSYVAAGSDAATAHAMANTNLCSDANGGLGYCVYTIPQNEYLIGTNGRLNPHATLGNRIYSNGSFYTLLPDDWTKETYRTGFRQEYNFSVSGAGDKYSLYTSFGYLDEGGIIEASNYERYSGRLRGSYQPLSWLTTGANVSYAHSTNTSTASLGYDGSYVTGGVFNDAANIAPIYPLYVRDAAGNFVYDKNGIVYDWGNGKYNSDGLVRPAMTNTNSLNELFINYYSVVANNINADINADVDLPYGFRATVKAGTTVHERRVKSSVNPYYGYSASYDGSLSVSHYRTTTFNFQQLLNWNHSYGDHNIQALIGHESYNYKYETLSASKHGAADYKNLTELNGYLTFPSSPTSYSSAYNTEGYIFRAMYDLHNRYFAQASFRRDASSRFAPDHRWGNFWSLGGAWIISRENWFHSKTFDNLKFKLSYGEVGNDNIGDYRYVDMYMVDNINGKPSFSFYSKGNPDITWETISNLNTGLEFDLFGYRLGGSVEFYNKKSSDMLLWFSTPDILGYSGYYKNIGDMRNTGVDVILHGTPIRTKNVDWSISLNFNANNQRVTYLPAENKTLNLYGHGGYTSGSYYYIGEGLPLQTMLVAEWAGVNDEGLGTWYTLDSDGNRITTTNYSSVTTKAKKLIKADQPVKGGFSSSLKAFGFDLSLQFAFGIGGKGIDSEYMQLMTSPVGTATGLALHKDILNSWTPENPTSDIPRFCYGDEYTGIFSTRYMTSLSYLSFQNFQLGYTVPVKKLAKLGVKNLRVYVSGDNIYLWSKRKGFDPRLSAGYGSYSPMRTISGGINIQL